MNKEHWQKLAGDFKSGAFLIDKEIVAALEKGHLVTKAAVAQAKYACYEVRVGKDRQQLVLVDQPGEEKDVYRGKQIGADETFSLNPGDTFKVYAEEELYMPADVFAFAIPVGNLYKLGLNPETTFADPGFSGPFYLTISNYSGRVVKLKAGDALARLFFFKLPSRPEKIHEGNPRDIPPRVTRIARRSREDLSKLGDLALMDNVLRDVDPPHYEHAFLTSQILAVRRHSAAVVLLSFFSYLLSISIATLYIFRVWKSSSPSFYENMVAEMIGLALGIGITLLFPSLRRAILRAFSDAAGRLSA